VEAAGAVQPLGREHESTSVEPNGLRLEGGCCLGEQEVEHPRSEVPVAIIGVTGPRHYGLVVKQIDKQASAAKGPRDRRPRRSDLRALRCTIMNSAATAPLLYLAALLQSGVRWSGPSMTSRSDCRA
jgi:hypothetical protein